MIRTGDQVEVGGAIASVEAVWAQGRHTHCKLSDGRTILDLDLLIKAGNAKLIAAPVLPKARFGDFRKQQMTENESD